jgi:hypothetical protein
VTLYAASEGKPVQVAQGKTGGDGTFKLDVGADKRKGSVLYVVARGGTPQAAGAPGAPTTPSRCWRSWARRAHFGLLTVEQ